MKLFNLNDTAVILIDHQVGTNTWASSTPLELLQRNVMILARFAAGTGMPVVLTSSQETNVNVQGPLMPELQAALPEAFAARVKRQGVVNAWDDAAFADVPMAPGRSAHTLGVIKHFAPYSSSPNCYFSISAFSPDGEHDETLQSQ